jgi:hypothetical protein
VHARIKVFPIRYRTIDILLASDIDNVGSACLEQSHAIIAIVVNGIGNDVGGYAKEVREDWRFR